MFVYLTNENAKTAIIGTIEQYNAMIRQEAKLPDKVRNKIPKDIKTPVNDVSISRIEHSLKKATKMVINTDTLDTQKQILPNFADIYRARRID